MLIKPDHAVRSPEVPGELLRALMLLWLSGAALRATILALPPVLPHVTAELGLRATDIGVLTGLPPLLFALAALPGAVLIARFDALSTLVVGLLVNAFGAASRGFAASTVALEAATAVMCLGVAVMQPAMPVLVRTWTPARIGLATAVYTNGLFVGEVVPTAWIPQSPLPVVGAGWHATLAVWAAPVLAIAVLVFTLGRRPLRAVDGPRSIWWPDWRDGRVWRLGLLFGGVNATYFGLNGFLPGWLNATGHPHLVQPALIALNLAQIPASLLMLGFAGRLVRNPATYGCAGSLLLASVLGIVLIPGPATIAWAASAGFAGAVLLTLSLALPSLLGEARDVPRLSAAMFTISYGSAMGMALLAGRLGDMSGMPSLAVSPFALTASLTILFGVTLKVPDPIAR